MQKVRVWEPSEPVPAGEWERRLSDSEAEIVAVLEPDQDEVLPALVLQLGDASLISAYSPVTDALKVVLDGLVVDSIDRDDVVELCPPFAFRVKSALPVIKALDRGQPIDLLEALAASIEPVVFRP
ncbi:MAG TPA: hypothetical protein VJ796_03110 [Acidimicrobiia bacterium]|jgi:hypothetical protein|nr:hypothetical protein [Acidimicrobiia bacterium]